MEFNVVIPARLNSIRLPRKVLVDIAGKPMVQHVYETAKKSGAANVILATDSDEVKAVAEGFGAKVCMTSSNHQSGTERIGEVIEKMGFAPDSIVINLQGDEPLMPAQVVSQVAANLAQRPEANVTTLCVPLTDPAELKNVNIVKVIFDKDGYAIYFSRSPIPCDREAVIAGKTDFSPYAQYYRHVGLYAYRVSSIRQYLAWPKCYLEQMETLEQLRVLWNGGKIHVDLAMADIPIGVDTEADLNYIRSQFIKSR